MYDEERITVGARVARRIGSSVYNTLLQFVRAKRWPASVEQDTNVSYPQAILAQGMWWVPDWRGTDPHAREIIVKVDLRTFEIDGTMVTRLEVGAHYRNVGEQDALNLAIALNRATGVNVNYEIWGTDRHFRVP
jgi:hypothetical protein